MNSKLKEAIESGTRERAKILEAASRPDPERELTVRDELRKKTRACKKWIEENFFVLVKQATSRGVNELRLGYAGHDLPFEIDQTMVGILNSLSGVTAALHRESVNMQDNSAPCWETVKWITVTWKKS